MEQPDIPSADLLQRLRKRIKGDVDKADNAIREQLVSGTLSATGISNVEPWDRRAIDRSFWSPLSSRFSLQCDLNAGVAQRSTGRRGPGASEKYSAIEFVWKDSLRIWQWLAPASKAGRPNEYDWVGAIAHVREYVARDGLPGVQMRLVEVAREWFEGQYGGHSPDEKHIRTKVVRPIYDAHRPAK